MASETDFVVLDVLAKAKPDISIHTVPDYTIWYDNETFDQLDEKLGEERKSLIEAATKNFGKIKMRYKDRKKN